jgi:isoleucyl-tRNA synthetase
LSRLLGPFTPFVADAMHRNLVQGASVHLADYPSADPAARDEDLEREMADARQIVAEGLAARDAARVRVRQPLRSVTLTRTFRPEIVAIIRDELNVKEVLAAEAFALDTEIDDELRWEGMARDAVRLIQDRRKRVGLKIEDRIVLFAQAEGDWRQVLERHGEYIAGETLAVEVRLERPEDMEGATLKNGLWIDLKRAS